MTSTVLSNSTVSNAVSDAFVISQPNTAVSTGVENTVAPYPDVQGSSDLSLAALSGDHCKCPYSEFFWSAFSCIRTEYGEIRSPNAGKYGPE